MTTGLFDQMAAVREAEDAERERRILAEVERDEFAIVCEVEGCRRAVGADVCLDCAIRDAA